MNESGRYRNEVVFAATVCLISGYVALTAMKFPKEARAFPLLVSRVTIALSALEGVLAGIRMRGAAKDPRSGQAGGRNALPSTLLLTALAILAYPLLIWLVGFYPTTAIFMPVMIYLLGVKKPLHVLAATASILGLVVVIFAVVLQLRMPIGILWGGD